MRRFSILGAGMAPILGAGMALLLGAVVVTAASPAPSPSPRPSASPGASSAPVSPAAPTKPSATQPSFTAQVQPLQLAGSATVAELKGGVGTMTLKLSGLLGDQRWTVDVEAGTVALPNERIEIAVRSGNQVNRLGTDTIRIHLTRAEMAAFLEAQKSGGAVAIVSDGARVGYAAFTGA